MSSRWHLARSPIAESALKTVDGGSAAACTWGWRGGTSLGIEKMLGGRDGAGRVHACDASMTAIFGTPSAAGAAVSRACVGGWASASHGVQAADDYCIMGLRVKPLPAQAASTGG